MLSILLLPSVVLTAVGLFASSKAPLTGIPRLLLLSLSMAIWWPPLVLAAGHGVMPIPIGTMLFVKLIPIRDFSDFPFSVLLAQQWGFLLICIAVLTLIAAAILKLLFPFWSVGKAHGEEPAAQ